MDPELRPPPRLVVGVVASAGGLPAMTALFRALASHADLAFLVVPHQHPDHASLLPELLSAQTGLTVEEARDGMLLLAGQILVAPSSAYVRVAGGRIRLTDRHTQQPIAFPIDHFLFSLAEEYQRRAVAVILSGTGNDGRAGAQAIHAQGGRVFAQDPSSAAYESMPRAAIDAGIVDSVVAPGDVPRQLAAYLGELDQPPTRSDDDIPWASLARICELLHERTGHDFSSYKTSTIGRRIQRRMVVRRARSVQDYIRELEREPAELDILFGSFLIGVTSFFRDPEVWEALAAGPLSENLKARPAELPFRVWVPACSTGEEAFTLAIVINEAMDRLALPTPITVFATDLDARAIARARAAIYPASALADMRSDRLERHFVNERGQFRVRRELREQVVFAQHDLLSDPPFTKLDLLSCRNLLIYLDANLQQRLLPSFHYALARDGLLLLGTSESVGTLSDGFQAVNSDLRIFRRLERGPTLPPRPASSGSLIRPTRHERTTRTSVPEENLASAVDRRLVERYLPPAIVVNAQGDIIHVRGRTGAFFELGPGQPSHNAFAMAREGLGLVLAASVRQALAHGPVTHAGVQVKVDQTFVGVTLTVEPLDLGPASPRFALVTFETEPRTSAGPTPEVPVADVQRVLQLEEEMRRTRRQLHASIAELQAANAEQQSLNEELQSSNEELETSKEEMHSLNEELRAVNTELQLKVDQLSQVNDDMANLMNSNDIATVFLDRQLRIKRFTQPARALINLLDGDIGRPIAHLRSTLIADSLSDDAASVLATLRPLETEVASRDGRSYLLRILPYRTTENVIDGLVLSFVDTTELNKLKALEASRRIAAGIVDTVREPLLVLDGEMRVVRANAAFVRSFKLGARDLSGVELSSLGPGLWTDPGLRGLLAAALQDDSPLENVEVEGEVEGLGHQRLRLNARRLVQSRDQPTMLLAAIELVADH